MKSALLECVALYVILCLLLVPWFL